MSQKKSCLPGLVLSRWPTTVSGEDRVSCRGVCRGECCVLFSSRDLVIGIES